MKPFLVSVITPTYNSSQFIKETIDSILAQTYTNWELLVTDDCSTDDTWEILTEYAQKDARIKLFKLNKNSGAGIARNNSIKHASGRFIAFCDSDDLWLPEKLEKQIKFMQAKRLSFTYSAYLKTDEDRNLIGIFIPPAKITYTRLLRTCDIGCLTAIYDTERLGKIHMPTIRKRQDYGLWLKIFRQIRETEGLHNEALAYYRIRSNSVSNNKFAAARFHFRMLRDIGGVSFIRACYNFMFYFINGIIKHIK